MRQLLDAATKAKWLARARLLRPKLLDGALSHIVFSNDKIFTVRTFSNQQNDPSALPLPPEHPKRPQMSLPYAKAGLGDGLGCGQ